MTELSDQTRIDDRLADASRPRLRYNPKQVRDDRAFNAARRHTTLVKRLRIILPALAIAGVVVFWATVRSVPGDFANLVKMSGINVASNSVIMQKPHISGFEGTRQSYDVRANSAEQSLSDPKVVTFNDIEGHFGLDETGDATVTAAEGVYDGNKNTLKMGGGITITTTKGYSGKLTNAAIDLAKGSMTSSGGLQLSMSEGSIRAQTMVVTERGKHVLFTGAVSVTYMPTTDLTLPPPVAAGNTTADP